MVNAKIKCPYCQAPNPVDYKNRFCGCVVCHQTINIHKAEVIEAPKIEEKASSEYDENGKELPSVKKVALMCILTGWLGIDFFVYKQVYRGLFSIIFCWTGVSFVLSIFRMLDIMALEPDEVTDYYQRKGRFSKSGHKYAVEYDEEKEKQREEELKKAKEGSENL